MAEDLTGQKSFLRNVMFSWGGYAVYIIAGFILPRLISDRLGQDALGVWDFAWTAIAYFGLIELGVGASVDRYVAKHRAAGDTDGLNRSVSSLFACLLALAAVILAASGAVGVWTIPAFSSQLGVLTFDTRWIVIVLGAGLAVEVALGVFWGVLVGLHRWDLHNSVSAAIYTVSTVAMILALSFGSGLVSLAVIHCTCSVSGHLIRMVLAYRVCPELKVRLGDARWGVVKEQTRFSAKNLIPRFADLFANQSVNLMLALALGPGALAIFARPRALVKHLRTMIGKVSSILIPSASALQAQGELGELRAMVLRRSQQVGALVVPAILALCILGDAFIELWMGKEYVTPGLVPVVCFGFLATLLQDPIWAVMSGMNQHGRVAFVKLAGSVIAAGLVALSLWPFSAGLLGAAIALTCPFIITDGVIVPWLACRRLAISLKTYYSVALLKPLIVAGPAVLVALAVRMFSAGHSMLTLTLGGVLGGVVLAAAYIRSGTIPARRLAGRFSRRRAATITGTEVS